jgi:hypothetical protein
MKMDFGGRISCAGARDYFFLISVVFDLMMEKGARGERRGWEIVHWMRWSWELLIYASQTSHAQQVPTRNQNDSGKFRCLF